jgi:hypothetical protein
VSDSPGAPRAQASSPQTIVTDLRSRDRWSIAFNEAAPANKLTKFDVALGNRLVLHHCCKPPHRCDPGYDTLMQEMRVSRSTLMRGIAAIEATGWIARKRGGRDDNVSFTFTIPPRVTELANPGRIGVNMLTPMEVGPYVSKTASIGVTQADTSNEQRNRVERSALQARASYASGLADTVGPEIKQNGASVSRARGQAALDVPYGDDGYIEFGDTPPPQHHPTSVYASST